MTKEQELLDALLLAVNEAEGWYDDCRSLFDGQEMDTLKPCYAILNAAGMQSDSQKRKPQ